MKIAFIPPIIRSDYMANTILDGILQIKMDGGREGFYDILARSKVGISVVAFLKDGYDQDILADEYRKIMAAHSTKARVMTILNKAREKGIIDIL